MPVVLHKVMLAGEGCFVTRSILTLFIRRNCGRALPVYHYPFFSQYCGHFLSERGEQMRPQTGSMW
jgi:hypothetical protein